LQVGPLIHTNLGPLDLIPLLQIQLRLLSLE
jgi:hypothetical protein